MSPLLYWLLELCSPLTQGDWFYTYGTRLQFAVVAFVIILQTVKPSHRRESGLYFLSIHIIYTLIMDSIFNGVQILWFYIETSLFSLWAVWIAMRPEISTSTINRDNVLLGFYKGNRGTWRMYFAQIFGMPVKSVCIIAGKKLLRIKNGRFVVSENSDIVIKSKDYYIHDTGTTINRNILSEIESYDNLEARNGLFRCDCITLIEPLLAKIGKNYVPNNIFERFPGIYLRKCLSGGQSE